MANKIYTPLAWNEYKVIQKARALVDERVSLVEKGITFNPEQNISMNGFTILNIVVNENDENSAVNVNYLSTKLNELEKPTSYSAFVQSDDKFEFSGIVNDYIMTKACSNG